MTIFQTLYLYFLRFGGIYVAYGLALIAKSMHDFWKEFRIIFCEKNKTIKCEQLLKILI